MEPEPGPVRGQRLGEIVVIIKIALQMKQPVAFAERLEKIVILIRPVAVILLYHVRAPARAQVLEPGQELEPVACVYQGPVVCSVSFVYNMAYQLQVV